MIKYFLDRGESAKMDSWESDLNLTFVSLTGNAQSRKAIWFLVDYSEKMYQNPLKLENHTDIVNEVAGCGNVNFFEKVFKMGANA